MIYWFTGQPGSGKTTIVRGIRQKYLLDSFIVDGDDIREIFDNKDYSEAGRRKNIDLAQKISQYLNTRGEDVLVSLVSPYKDQRDAFKELMSDDVHEFYVHTENIRGREDFFVSDYSKPDGDYSDINTTDVSIEETIEMVFDIIKTKQI
jgi:adenylylsulfate kinase-like enzyme